MIQRKTQSKFHKSIYLIKFKRFFYRKNDQEIGKSDSLSEFVSAYSETHHLKPGLWINFKLSKSNYP